MDRNPNVAPPSNSPQGNSDSGNNTRDGGPCNETGRGVVVGHDRNGDTMQTPDQQQQQPSDVNANRDLMQSAEIPSSENMMKTSDKHSSNGTERSGDMMPTNHLPSNGGGDVNGRDDGQQNRNRREGGVGGGNTKQQQEVKGGIGPTAPSPSPTSANAPSSPPRRNSSSENKHQHDMGSMRMRSMYDEQAIAVASRGIEPLPSGSIAAASRGIEPLPSGFGSGGNNNSNNNGMSRGQGTGGNGGGMGLSGALSSLGGGGSGSGSGSGQGGPYDNQGKAATTAAVLDRCILDLSKRRIEMAKRVAQQTQGSNVDNDAGQGCGQSGGQGGGGGGGGAFNPFGQQGSSTGDLSSMDGGGGGGHGSSGMSSSLGQSVAMLRKVRNDVGNGGMGGNSGMQGSSNGDVQIRDGIAEQAKRLKRLKEQQEERIRRLRDQQAAVMAENERRNQRRPSGGPTDTSRNMLPQLPLSPPRAGVGMQSGRGPFSCASISGNQSMGHRDVFAGSQGVMNSMGNSMTNSMGGRNDSNSSMMNASGHGHGHQGGNRGGVQWFICRHCQTRAFASRSEADDHEILCKQELKRGGSSGDGPSVDKIQIKSEDMHDGRRLPQSQAADDLFNHRGSFDFTKTALMSGNGCGGGSNQDRNSLGMSNKLFDLERAQRLSLQNNMAMQDMGHDQLGSGVSSAFLGVGGNNDASANYDADAHANALKAQQELLQAATSGMGQGMGSGMGQGMGPNMGGGNGGCGGGGSGGSGGSGGNNHNEGDHGPYAQLPKPIPLSMPSDKDWITPLHCFIRRHCVEVFTATPADVATPSKGKRRPIQVGQVGIRCPHCHQGMNHFDERSNSSHYPHHRERGSVYYPTTIASIYNATMNLLQRHLDACPSVPPEVMARYRELKADDARSATSKRYWMDSARSLGLVDTPGAGGIRFSASAPPPLPRLSKQQVSAGIRAATRRNSNDFFSNKSNVLAGSSGSYGSGMGGAAGDKRKIDAVSGPLSRNSRLGMMGDDPRKQIMGSGSPPPLVTPEDEVTATAFSYQLLSQMQPCVFTEADRLGKRKGLPAGFAGLACRHCYGGYGSGRFFPSSIKTLSDTSKTLNVLNNHMMRCRKCPPEVREVLEKLKKGHDEERARMKFGSQKAFFAKIWDRLHNKGNSATLNNNNNSNNNNGPGQSQNNNPSGVNNSMVGTSSQMPLVPFQASIKALQMQQQAMGGPVGLQGLQPSPFPYGNPGAMMGSGMMPNGVQHMGQGGGVGGGSVALNGDGGIGVGGNGGTVSGSDVPPDFDSFRRMRAA